MGNRSFEDRMSGKDRIRGYRDYLEVGDPGRLPLMDELFAILEVILAGKRTLTTEHFVADHVYTGQSKSRGVSGRPYPHWTTF